MKKIENVQEFVEKLDAIKNGFYLDIPLPHLHKVPNLAVRVFMNFSLMFVP